MLTTFTNTKSHPVAINPAFVMKVAPHHQNDEATVVTMAGGESVVLALDFVTVRDQLSSAMR